MTCKDCCCVCLWAGPPPPSWSERGKSDWSYPGSGLWGWCGEITSCPTSEREDHHWWRQPTRSTQKTPLTFLFNTITRDKIYYFINTVIFGSMCCSFLFFSRVCPTLQPCMRSRRPWTGPWGLSSSSTPAWSGLSRSRTGRKVIELSIVMDYYKCKYYFARYMKNITQ